MERNGARKPLTPVKNGALLPAKPTLSAALGSAIDSLSAELLRGQVKFLCHKFPEVMPALESGLLVQGKDVVRYHADTDSENDLRSETGSEDSASDSGANDKPGSDKKRRPIAKGDEECTARIAMCENCHQEFDVTQNCRGDCIWHPGWKDADFESDFWADHDPDCHGPYDSFRDDPDFAEGFLWDCCNKPGDGEGCKSTKHKAAVNIVVPESLPVVPPTKKRKAEEVKPAKSVKKGRK